MEVVHPIKEIHQIDEIKTLLKKQSKRDFLLFVLGINTGIRSSDLLQIKVRDVITPSGDIKEFYELPIHSKSKMKKIYLNEKVKNAIRLYLNETPLQLNDFLFKSKKDPHNPITRQQAYRVINQAAKEVGISHNVGTHTLRKTYGYHAFRKGIAISFLQSLFNHATPSETLR
ncbi:integrase [Oikeobacillus pervagus]|uniref:Integrase n=1 Tax=Oikeobacillus pervagus TaxID=1325931 RepID=A0AAJ1T8B2_9BACI|nr:tyrosine-type recombinase/integrase [Oikeobacillus pervagus]MDQ0216455.1 integrase [Oikeobacillus pervagus]